MAYPKVITATRASSVQKRKARRASRNYSTPIIIFRNDNDEKYVHMRTKATFNGGSVLYWNWVGLGITTLRKNAQYKKDGPRGPRVRKSSPSAA